MNVIQLGDPILRRPAIPVEKIEIIQEETKHVIDKMIAVLKAIKVISPTNGNAIAAPQVGHSVRIIVLFYDNEYHVMINPVYLDKSEELIIFDEECFSMYYLRGKVKRHKKVTVSYLDLEGKEQKMYLEGDPAAYLQHELDHLNGILFIDKLLDGEKLSTVFHELRDNPERLETVRRLITYMTS